MGYSSSYDFRILKIPLSDDEQPFKYNLEIPKYILDSVSLLM
jgi:hypothetical protein